MTTLQSPQLFAHLWKATLASGLIALALGVVVLVWPGPSILVAAVLFGLFLVLSGIVEMVFAFTLDVSVGNRILLFISGALAVILGVLAFRHFRPRICSSVTGHLDRSCCYIPRCFGISIGDKLP